MATGTLTSKGQTTIPKEIRQHLGLRPGDKIRFMVEEDGRVVVIPATLSVKDLRGSLPKPPRAVSLSEMKAAVRKRAARQ